MSVNVAEMQLATNSIASMPTTSLDKAAADVRDDAQRLVEPAGSLDLCDNAEGTALLTAFTGLAVDCTMEVPAVLVPAVGSRQPLSRPAALGCSRATLYRVLDDSAPSSSVTSR